MEGDRKDRVFIRNNGTGETRQDKDLYDWSSHHEFWWTEGNASCDCNRGIFFGDYCRTDDDDFAPCGDDKYSIFVLAPDDSILYDERK